MAIIKKAKSKYGNKKTEKYGHKWDSMMELEYYEFLLDLKEQGEVIDIELQPVFLIQDKFTYQGKNIRKIEYKSDFRVKYFNGYEEVIDVKGQTLSTFLLKFKLVKFRYPDTIFKCVRSRGRKPNKIWEDLGI